MPSRRVIKRDVLVKALQNDKADFGKHIIPDSIEHRQVFAHIFQGYWEDIGTIRAFFEANLDLTSLLPRFNFFDMTAPISEHCSERWMPRRAREDDSIADVPDAGR